MHKWILHYTTLSKQAIYFIVTSNIDFAELINIIEQNISFFSNTKKHVIFDISPIYRNTCFGGALINKLTNLINQNSIINFHIRCSKILINIVKLSWIESITNIINNYCIISHKNQSKSALSIHTKIKSIFFQ